MKCDGTDLVDHIAFGVPTLVSHIPINLDKLLENGGIATGTLGRKAGRVVKMAVHIAVMFIVRVLGTKERWADRACEMFDVEFLV
jgi:hypothetical protein